MRLQLFILSKHLALLALPAITLVACESKVKVGEFFDTDSSGEQDDTTGQSESSGQDATSGTSGDASGAAQTGAGESGGGDTTGAGGSTTGPAEPDVEVAALCQDHVDDLRSGQKGECECLVIAGVVDDVETCLAPKEAILAEVHACRCEVLAMFPDAEPAVACLAAAAESLATCLATWTCTDDYEDCTDPFLAAAAACELPPAAEALLAEQCPPAEFVCGSGEAVLVTSRCDVKVDCEDQSDEKACP